MNPTSPIMRAASTAFPGRPRPSEPERVLGPVAYSTRRRRPTTTSRRYVLWGATAVALLSTAGAYVAMVAFGVDVLEMSPQAA